jgi:hypothetical protein
MAKTRRDGKEGGDKAKPGVWNRGSRRGPDNPIRVRTKRLDQIDQDKIALAYWLLAKELAEDKSDGRPISEAEVRRVARRIDDQTPDEPTKRRAGGRR